MPDDVKSLPFSLWKPFTLGVVSCLAWLGAVAADLWKPAQGDVPMWLRIGAHVVLVLAPAALAPLWLKTPRLPARQHPRAFFAALALVALVLAIPSLWPYGTTSDLISLPLRVPTLSLGVAIAAVDPSVIEQWKKSHSRDESVAVVTGVCFSVTLIIIGVLGALLSSRNPQCTGARLACGAITSAVNSVVFVATLMCGIFGVFGAWLGHRIGGIFARSSRWYQ